MQRRSAERCRRMGSFIRGNSLGFDWQFIFDTKDENNNTDKRIKLIRNDSIGRLSYDFDYNNDLVSVTFNNKWAESSIKKVLLKNSFSEYFAKIFFMSYLNSVFAG